MKTILSLSFLVFFIVCSTWNKDNEETQYLNELVIEENSKIIHLKSDKDYRLLKFGNVRTYHYPNNEQTDLNMQQYFSSIAPDWFNWFTRKPVFEGATIPVNNRDIDVRFLSSNTVWFAFNVICGDRRSQNDYIEISKIYQNVFISDVPKMDNNSIDSVVVTETTN